MGSGLAPPWAWCPPPIWFSLEEPLAWQLGRFPGPKPCLQGGRALCCSSGAQGAEFRVCRSPLAKLGDRISSPPSLSRLCKHPDHPGEGPGPPGNLPKAFSLVSLGRDPEKDSKCPSGEGGDGVGPGPAWLSREAPGALERCEVPLQPKQFHSQWALGRAGWPLSLPEATQTPGILTVLLACRPNAEFHGNFRSQILLVGREPAGGIELFPPPKDDHKSQGSADRISLPPHPPLPTKMGPHLQPTSCESQRQACGTAEGQAQPMYPRPPCCPDTPQWVTDPCGLGRSRPDLTGLAGVPGGRFSSFSPTPPPPHSPPPLGTHFLKHRNAGDKSLAAVMVLQASESQIRIPPLLFQALRTWACDFLALSLFAHLQNHRSDTTPTNRSVLLWGSAQDPVCARRGPHIPAQHLSASLHPRPTSRFFVTFSWTTSAAWPMAL